MQTEISDLIFIEKIRKTVSSAKSTKAKEA